MDEYDLRKLCSGGSRLLGLFCYPGVIPKGCSDAVYTIFSQVMYLNSQVLPNDQKREVIHLLFLQVFLWSAQFHWDFS